MLELHESTCDYVIPFYERAQRYMNLSISLLKQGFLKRDETLTKIRIELYGLYNHILQLLLPLERRLGRFDSQIRLHNQGHLMLSNDFWLSLECVQADILIFRQFMTDLDFCDNFLEHII